MNKKNILIGVIIAVVIIMMIAAMVLLIPMDKHNREIRTYGDLAVAAETDERARYIIDNIEEYPDFLIDTYYKYNAEKKQQFIEFFYEYPFHKNDYKNLTFTEEELNCDSIPRLFMKDTRWGYERIGKGYIFSYGCAAVGITMANLYLTHRSNVDPLLIAELVDEMGAAAPFGGINSLHVREICEAVGLTCDEFIYDKDVGGSGEADPEYIRNAVNNGHAVMLGMVGETFGGHAVIIRSLDEDGTMYINDPGNPDNCEKAWSFEELKPEIYYIWDLSYSK